MNGWKVPPGNVVCGSAISITLQRGPGPIKPAVWHEAGAACTRSRISAAEDTSLHENGLPRGLEALHVDKESA